MADQKRRHWIASVARSAAVFEVAVVARDDHKHLVKVRRLDDAAEESIQHLNDRHGFVGHSPMGSEIT
jgi:hypothetical protein